MKTLKSRFGKYLRLKVQPAGLLKRRYPRIYELNQVCSEVI
jgi:hypothetical protein